MVRCGLRGCKRPVFVEPRTNIVHKYCGRSHAEQAEGNIPPPHGDCHVCNLKGCVNPIAFDVDSGRVHDFCSKSHAEYAIRHGQWPAPHRETNSKLKVSRPCALPGCGLQVYSDASGQTFEYCGRSHSIEHRRDPSALSALTPVISSSSSSGARKPSSHSIPASKPPPTSSSAVASRPSLITSAPLCCVCQEYKANVILLPCGHVCLCEEHEKQMKRNQALKICPCCQQAVVSTNKVYLNF